MRSHGLVESPHALGADGHACWAYEDLGGDFRDAAIAFLSEGVDLGQALMFVGGADAEEVVRTVEPMSSMVAAGSLQVAPFDEVYPGGRRLANADQWSFYAAATEKARLNGFTGMRVLAEVTSLAGPDDGWREHALWETYADRRMSGFPLAAMCCFERDAVTPRGLAVIASAHPVVDRRLEHLVPFRLFGGPYGLELAGEIDAFSSGTLRHLLRADNGATADQVLDLDQLSFIEHTGLRTLREYAEWADGHGVTITFRGGPPSLRRLTDLLGVSL